MAGRDISVEREAIGPIRVMRTCGMMGEVVGKAAWSCVRFEHFTSGCLREIPFAARHDLMKQPGVTCAERVWKANWKYLRVLLRPRHLNWGD
jgi:hypothetical protein